MPSDNAGSTHVSLRVPSDLIQAFDKLAVMLDRPRSWVMLRALRQYLEDEGAELTEDAESLAELDRVPPNGVRARGRSRSPADLAGFVRRPRRAA